MKEFLAGTTLSLIAFYTGYGCAVYNARRASRQQAIEELQDRRLHNPRP